MHQARLEELLTTEEAAFVSGVSSSDVDHAVNQRILPDALLLGGADCFVLAGACPLIGFYYGSASNLAHEARLRIVQIAAADLMIRLPATWPELQHRPRTIQDGSVTIDLQPLFNAAAERHAELIDARSNVTTSTEILGGVPVIYGTRIPAHDVAASVAAGLNSERILASYPSLDARKIRLATIYAAANPPRGGSAPSKAPPAGTVIMVDRRIPRTKAG